MVTVSSEWRDVGYALALLLFLGMILLVIGKPVSEGFDGGGLQRCDVDSPCPGHLKCLNGFCAKTEPMRAYEQNPVPVLPGGAPYPYF
jgi:hypothetical protein